MYNNSWRRTPNRIARGGRPAIIIIQGQNGKGSIGMKKKIGLLLAAMLLASLFASAMAESVYFSGACHVRTGPGSWYESLGIVNKGSYLTYDGDSTYSDGATWYSVIFHGEYGWVSSKYAWLSDEGGAATYSSGGQGGSYDTGASGSFDYGASVYISGNCNVRYGPSLSYDPMGTAYKGDVLYGTGDINTDSRGIDWYSVRFKGSEGWVSSVYASIGGEASYYEYEDDDEYTVVVGTDGDSHVRTGPGLGYSKLGVLHKGSSADFLGDTSVDSRGVEWYKISWNSSSGWVSSRYTTLY